MSIKNTLSIDGFNAIVQSCWRDPENEIQAHIILMNQPGTPDFHEAAKCLFKEDRIEYEFDSLGKILSDVNSNKFKSILETNKTKVRSKLNSLIYKKKPV